MNIYAEFIPQEDSRRHLFLIFHAKRTRQRWISSEMHLIFFSKAIAAPVLYESRGTDVLGQLVPLRRLSVLIGHGVPSGYPSRVMLKPSRTIRGGTKPRASIYLWSRIAGVYVEPPLHNHNALFPASIAYRMKPFLLRF